MGRLLQRAPHRRRAPVVPILSAAAGAPGWASPALVADVGGTHARFAIARDAGAIENLRVLPCDRFASLHDAIGTYLTSVDSPVLRRGALAIAAAVDGDEVSMTNRPWRFSIARLRSLLGLESLLVVNDLAAAAMAVPSLGASECKPIGGGEAHPGAPMCVIGSGTGLGVAALVRAGGGWSVIASEGGHATFSPADHVDAAILRYAWTELEHVSSERLLSGPGIALIHRALRALGGLRPQVLEVDEIVRRARAGECALCAQTLTRFSAMLGTFAANCALTIGARGGVYLAGGVALRLGDSLDRALFRARFEGEGRFRNYLSCIPTLLVTREHPGLLGLAAMLGRDDRL